MKRTSLASNMVLVLLSLTLAACATIRAGPTRIADSTDPRFAQIREAMSTRCYNVTRQVSDPEELRIIRNDLVTAYMAAVDDQYFAYELALLENVRTNSFAASLSVSVLSAVAAVVGDPHLAQGLTTAVSIITAGNKSYTTDQLLNQTVSVLQTQMQASRAAKSAVILGRLALPYANWNFCRALSDAQAYEHAGTLNAALTEIAATAAQARRTNEARAEAAIPTVEYTTGTLINALSTYFDPNNSDIQGRMSRALEAMSALGLGPEGDQTPRERLGEIARDPPFDVQRRQLVAAIIPLERPHNAQAADQLQAALGN